MSEKLTEQKIDEMIKQLLNEDQEYRIKKETDEDFVTFGDLDSFANFISSNEFDTNKKYTVMTPQTDDKEITAYGETIKEKFLGLATKEPELTPTKTGYLGDLPIENYRDDVVKLPQLYIDAFENSGFQEGDFTDRIQSLTNYMTNLPSVATADEQFSKIIVMELLEKIVQHITQAQVGKLKEGGFLFESFLCLLLSGTSPVSKTSYIDLIDNNLNNISVKFAAEKSSNYQAWSTVGKYFSKNKDPMIHIVAVKRVVSEKENSIIDIYRSEFTYNDYDKLISSRKEGDGFVETEKAVLIFSQDTKYKVQNDWQTNTAIIHIRSGNYETGQQPRITFKQYGDKIGTFTLLPPKALREFTKNKMNEHDANVDLLFKEITTIRKKSVSFFSSSEQNKREQEAKNIVDSYKLLKKYTKEGFKSRGVDQSFRESKLQSLDDLIAETIRDIKKNKKITWQIHKMWL